jgi:hypothetical protein
MNRVKLLSALSKTYISFVYWLGQQLIARGYQLEDHAIRMDMKDER